jgi:hypothetical protein
MSRQLRPPSPFGLRRGSLRSLRRTYDLHEYLKEKRAAFDKSAALIGRIVTAPRDNVVALRR